MTSLDSEEITKLNSIIHRFDVMDNYCHDRVTDLWQISHLLGGKIGTEHPDVRWLLNLADGKEPCNCDACQHGDGH